MNKLLIGLLLLVSVGMAGEGQSVTLDFGKKWEEDIHKLPPQLVVEFDYSRNRKSFIRAK